MSEGNDWREHDQVVAGALLCLGGMLYEWGMPLDKAIQGLRLAYAMEAAKQAATATPPLATMAVVPCDHTQGAAFCPNCSPKVGA